MTTFRQGYLEGKSTSGNCVRSLIRGIYDLAIFTSSWDSRCICICDACEAQSRYGLLILFEGRDSVGLREKHDKRLIEYAASKCGNVEYVKGFSVDVEGTWKQIFEKVLRFREYEGRPIKILLDLSTCPRYYALALVGCSLSYGIAEHISIFYAEGAYGGRSMGSAASNEYVFSKGHWRTVPVPSLQGTFDPEKKRYYLVSVGFEGPKTLQVINREDPDSISILFPQPGFIRDYVAVTEAENRELIHSYKVDDTEIIRVHAGDAVAVWKSLHEATIEKPYRDNVFYLCTGTKPHALGLALRALALGFPTVLYRVPERHNPLFVEPTGNFWRFDIQDLSSLVSTT